MGTVWNGFGVNGHGRDRGVHVSLSSLTKLTLVSSDVGCRRVQRPYFCGHASLIRDGETDSRLKADAKRGTR